MRTFKAVKVVMSLLTSQAGLGMKARAVSEQERAAIAAEGRFVGRMHGRYVLKLE